jgi:hypothetical protein
VHDYDYVCVYDYAQGYVHVHVHVHAEPRGTTRDRQYEKRRTLTFITNPSAAAVVRMLEPP